MDDPLLWTLTLVLLPSVNEVCEGYVFTPICHSVYRGVSRPTPRGEVGGSGWGVCLGGVQAQEWEVSGPGLGGGPGLGRGDLPQHALRQTYPPPHQTATAADGTHPTGMHSC